MVVVGVWADADVLRNGKTRSSAAIAALNSLVLKQEAATTERTEQTEQAEQAEAAMGRLFLSTHAGLPHRGPCAQVQFVDKEAKLCTSGTVETTEPSYTSQQKLIMECSGRVAD